MRGFATLPRSTVPISETLLLSFVGPLRFLSVACRAGSARCRTTPPLPLALPRSRFPINNSRADYVAVSEPRARQLPAPAAEDQTTLPWKTAASDFPHALALPMANPTGTSPVHVGANATPKHRMLFRRVYVDQLINSPYIHFQQLDQCANLHGPGSTPTVTVMAEDEQGYFPQTLLQVTVSAPAPNTGGLTTIRQHPRDHRVAIVRRRIPCGVWASPTGLRRWRRNSSVCDDCECDFDE